MNTKGFLLLLVTVIAIGGSIGGAFAGGLALGRSQRDGPPSGSIVYQQRFGGGQAPTGGLQNGSGQFGAIPSDAPNLEGIDGFARSFGEGSSAGPGGTETTVSQEAFNGTVSKLNGQLLTVTSGDNETQVDLGENSSIQIVEAGTTSDISQGDQVMVVATGDAESGGPVDAMLVTVNAPMGGSAFGGGFGARGGLGGSPIRTLIGSVSAVTNSQMTVATESGETRVNLGQDIPVQVHKSGTTDDLSVGVRVLVITATDDESGEPVTTTSVVVNPPEFGGGGSGGRPRRP